MRPKQNNKSTKEPINASITRSAATTVDAVGLWPSSPTPNGIISNGTTARQSELLLPTSSKGRRSAASASANPAALAANTKLCRLIRRNPCLYNRLHEDYGKKHFLEKTWTRIAKECNDSVASCKERWRNIRAAYARSVNLYKTSSGPNRVKPYYLHKEVSFLFKPLYEARNRRKRSIRNKTPVDDEKVNQDDDNMGEEDVDDDGEGDLGMEDDVDDGDGDLGKEDDDNDGGEIKTETQTEQQASLAPEKPTRIKFTNSNETKDEYAESMPLVIGKERISNSLLAGSNMCEITLDSISSDETLNFANFEFSLNGQSECLYIESDSEHDVEGQQNANINNITNNSQQEQTQQQQTLNHSDLPLQPQQPQEQQSLNNNHNCSNGTYSPTTRSLTMRPQTTTTTPDCQNDSNSNSNNNNNSSTCQDKTFFDALLPDMQAMSARQKIIFKRRIYEVLEEVLNEDTTDFPNRQRDHQQCRHNHVDQQQLLSCQCPSQQSQEPCSATSTFQNVGSVINNNETSAATSPSLSMLPMLPRLAALQASPTQAPTKNPSSTLSVPSPMTQQQLQQTQSRTSMPASNIKNEIKIDDDDDLILVD